mmetsp:Transcript_99339/g.320276  ORF Transcript_99339/g.320276 Transcript_99339/m.320276 type:complete len:309 (-) Transcript_99339:202-1128(-)
MPLGLKSRHLRRFLWESLPKQKLSERRSCRRTQERPHDVDPETVFGAGNRHLAPARRIGHEPGPEVPGRVPARLRDRGVEREQHRNSGTDHEGHARAAAPRFHHLVVLVGDAEDYECEDEGAPSLDDQCLSDRHVILRVRAGAPLLRQARVREVLAEGQSRQDGLRLAADNALGALEGLDSVRVHQQIDDGPEDGSNELCQDVQQGLDRSHPVCLRTYELEGQGDRGVQVRAAGLGRGVDRQGDAEAPDDGHLPDALVGSGERGADGAAADDHHHARAHGLGKQRPREFDLAVLFLRGFGNAQPGHAD